MPGSLPAPASLAAEPRPLGTEAPWRQRWLPANELVLLAVLLVECGVFGLSGSHFLSRANAFEITRLSVELGLLALALTAVIITGGIDLSVGSTMGLCAVVLGALWYHHHWPIAAAVGAALMVGLLGGALNAAMVARLGFPPLIVTLGTFSLFRGMAEGLTRGIENYSGFPAGFLFWGQGYLGGVFPTQLVVLLAALAACAWGLHATKWGRALFAIGHSAEGARYAGVPVARRLALVYVLSGFASSLAAVIYVAHLVVAGNWLLGRSLRDELRRGPGAAGAAGPAATAGHRPVIAMMPKAKGDPYFISCRKGADEAAAELGVELLWDGPTDLDPAKQNEVVEAWITRGVDAIAVSVENKEGISTVLRKAREKGIKVVTWDADAEKDARDFLINQATPQGIGETLTDEAARIMGGKGEFAIITASLSAANQNEWIKYIKQRLAEKYPDIKLVAIQPSEGDRDRAFAETQTVLKVYPNVKLVMAIAAPAVPGAAEAVKQAGRTDVKVTGLSLPNMNKPYVKSGVVESVVLWNTIDLGYLTVYAANALSAGQLKRNDTELTAGRVGKIEVADDEVRLGAPFVFNKSNIDQFNF